MFATIAAPVRNYLTLKHGAKWCQYISFILYAMQCILSYLYQHRHFPT